MYLNNLLASVTLLFYSDYIVFVFAFSYFCPYYPNLFLYYNSDINLFFYIFQSNNSSYLEELIFIHIFVKAKI